MPSLGADMTEGTITRWLVKPGDTVKRGDVVVEIETDKADMEVEIWDGGVVERILVPEGEKVPIGTPLAALVAAGEPGAAVPAPEPQPAPPAPPVQPRPLAHRATPTAQILAQRLGVDLSRVRGTGVDGAITRADVSRAAAPAGEAPHPAPRSLLISPRARQLARERGIDVSAIVGTGPAGSITAADIDRAAPPQAPAPERPEPAAGAPAVPQAPRIHRRGPIAALMERANREIPHYYLGIDIDLSAALEWLRNENARRPVTDRILYSALLLKATALAAHEHPQMNGYWEDGEFRPGEGVNLAVAISLRGGGLVAPAISDASALSLGDLMKQLQELVQRARAGRLRASEMSSGTITVTNLGEQGVDYVQGVIYAPQVALVGFGKVRERPWAEQGMLAVRPVVTATLAADHRASDGHRGALFLGTINKLLQEPEHL
ncbi:MAG: dihydrolipoamide acetyltransferase family protein [Dehalococcoidia bacterium]